MKLIPCNINEVMTKMPSMKWLEVFDEFDKSGCDCVEIKEYPHKTVKACCEAARIAIKKYRRNTLHVYTKGDRVFLTNVNLYE